MQVARREDIHRRGGGMIHGRAPQLNVRVDTKTTTTEAADEKTSTGRTAQLTTLHITTDLTLAEATSTSATTATTTSSSTSKRLTTTSTTASASSTDTAANTTSRSTSSSTSTSKTTSSSSISTSSTTTSTLTTSSETSTVDSTASTHLHTTITQTAHSSLASSATLSSSAAASPTASSSNSSISAGAVVGAVAAAIIGIAALVFGVTFIIRKRRQARDEQAFNEQFNAPNFRRSAVKLDDDSSPYLPRPPSMIERHLASPAPTFGACYAPGVAPQSYGDCATNSYCENASYGEYIAPEGVPATPASLSGPAVSMAGTPVMGAFGNEAYVQQQPLMRPPSQQTVLSHTFSQRASLMRQPSQVYNTPPSNADYVSMERASIDPFRAVDEPTTPGTGMPITPDSSSVFIRPNSNIRASVGQARSPRSVRVNSLPAVDEHLLVDPDAGNISTMPVNSGVRLDEFPAPPPMAHTQPFRLNSGASQPFYLSETQPLRIDSRRVKSLPAPPITEAGPFAAPEAVEAPAFAAPEASVFSPPVITSDIQRVSNAPVLPEIQLTTDDSFMSTDYSVPSVSTDSVQSTATPAIVATSEAPAAQQFVVPAFRASTSPATSVPETDLLTLAENQKKRETAYDMDNAYGGI
ncbi:hypothetical protein FISHEDRAFT_71199 [Fistulina hepatica ATCC 64428]|nr:hypothetical protein FISHEDRAFT_71199 [Fistulina hepatica ATCC 64428]